MASKWMHDLGNNNMSTKFTPLQLECGWMTYIIIITIYSKFHPVHGTV